MTAADRAVVTVWSWVAPFDLDGLEHLLDDVERSRRDRYLDPTDAVRFAAGAILLRCAVGGDPMAVSVDRTCARCGEPHGRPVVADAHVSVAHAGDAVLVAVTDLAPVGVDVEPVTPVDAEVVATACASEELAAIRTEADFTRVWTRKEAFLKAIGTGLRTDPATVVVAAPNRPAGVVSLGGGPPPPCTMVDLDAPAGHLASLAVLSEARPDVEHRSADAVVDRYRIRGD